MPGCGEGEAQHLACPDCKRSVRALFAAIEQHRHLCATHRHYGILQKLQLRPHQRTFKASSTRRVADQLIGGAQRILIKRAGGRDAQVVIAFTAQVLHRGCQARFEYLDHASTSCNDLG